MYPNAAVMRLRRDKYRLLENRGGIKYPKFHRVRVTSPSSQVHFCLGFWKTPIEMGWQQASSCNMQGAGYIRSIMVIDLPELRDKLGVFEDRRDGGIKLAKMLQAYSDSSAIVLAVPAGGVPVAASLAEKLNLCLDVVVVSKITLPWNTEAGFGAVAFDGTVRLNEQVLAQVDLTEQQVQDRIKLTAEKVGRRAIA